MKNKLLFFGFICFFAISVVFAAFNSIPASGEAVLSGSCGDDLTFVLTKDGTLTISGEGEMTNWSSQYDVPWIAERDSVKKVVIKDGVTSIGDYAFIGGGNLLGYDKTVATPNSLIPMGSIYDYDNLTSVTIADSVTSIGGWAFYNCASLKRIVIPKGVTDIGNRAFCNCTSLTGITIPDRVIDIGSCAFQNTAYYNNSSNWKNDVLYIGKHLIKAEKTLGGSYAVKSGTKAIADGAFEGCRALTDITIPNGVISVGDYAFEYCENLKGITFPDSVTDIGSFAFCLCKRLTDVTLSNRITDIGRYTFKGCKALADIKIPDSVTAVDSFAFSDCDSLELAELPESVKMVGENAFFGCNNLENLVVHSKNVDLSDAIVSENTAIVGFTDSDVHQYAKGNGYTFIPIEGSKWLNFSVKADNVYCREGSFDLPVKLVNNTGIAHIGLEVTYPDCVELVSVNRGPALASLSMTLCDELDADPVRITFDGSGVDLTDGIFMTLTFKIKENAEFGEYGFEIAVTEAYDENMQEVEVEGDTARLIIKDHIPGDINGDDVTDLKDVTVLRRYLAGGYGVTVDEIVADINRDGAADLKDVTVLRRYLAGGYGVELG